MKTCKPKKGQLQAKPVTGGKGTKPPSKSSKLPSIAAQLPPKPKVTAPGRPSAKRPPGEAPWPTIADDAKCTLAAMQKASNDFYRAAIATGCHAFIEFTGLMNEYIKVCQDMSSMDDHSWLTANTHTSTPLKMHSHQAAYLAEKLDCIYGPTLRAHPALAKAFKKSSRPKT